MKEVEPDTSAWSWWSPGRAELCYLSAVVCLFLLWLAGLERGEGGVCLKGEHEVGVRTAGWVGSSKTAAGTQSFGGCWSVCSKGW